MRKTTENSEFRDEKDKDAFALNAAIDTYNTTVNSQVKKILLHLIKRIMHKDADAYRLAIKNHNLDENLIPPEIAKILELYNTFQLPDNSKNLGESAVLVERTTNVVDDYKNITETQLHDDDMPPFLRLYWVELNHLDEHHKPKADDFSPR